VVESTADRPAPGLVVHQPVAGFRYAADAFWVVGWALERGVPRDCVDLGTGSGILALLLARHGVVATGIDAHEGWPPLWERTLRDSHVAADLRRMDVRQWRDAVDLVVCNPPFFRVGSGPMPADPWRRAARFEGEAGLGDFVEAAARSLRPGGRAVFVLPADRVDELHGGALAVRHEVVIGRRRAMVELGEPAAMPTRSQVPGRGEEVDRWYRRAQGLSAAP
jgi:tRNA1Val (adenine37-N6)-methyltransferase